MGRYIDGFVLPLRKDRVEEYRQMAEKAALIWKEHGALDYWECVGDDLEIPGMLSFTQCARAEPEETVIFAWVVFESREARDRVNQKIMTDPRLAEMMNSQIFDPQRMAYGGFAELVHG